jgi:hypothetical protein
MEKISNRINSGGSAGRLVADDKPFEFEQSQGGSHRFSGQAGGAADFPVTGRKPERMPINRFLAPAMRRRQQKPRKHPPCRLGCPYGRQKQAAGQFNAAGTVR